VTNVRAARKLRFVSSDLAALDQEREASVSDEGAVSGVEQKGSVRRGRLGGTSQEGQEEDRWLLGPGSRPRKD
jgi:hypothetical protein